MNLFFPRDSLFFFPAEGLFFPIGIPFIYFFSWRRASEIFLFSISSAPPPQIINGRPLMHRIPSVAFPTLLTQNFGERDIFEVLFSTLQKHQGHFY